MFHDDDNRPTKKKASLLAVVLLLLGIGATCFALQYNTIKKTVQMRLFDISSDYIVRKEEIKEITNQSISQIESTRQESLSVIENKTNEAETGDGQDVVSQDVVRAVNKARRETK
jgi:cob(I)alamin adenosyltransferase